MRQTEYISKNLGIPYVYLADTGKYVCKNGVVFTKKEYLDGINLKEEYIKRAKAGELYDYEHAKNTGELRKLTLKHLPEKKEAPAQTVLSQAKPEKTAKSIVLMCFALMLTSFGSMYESTVHTATYLLDYVDVISAWLMSGVITVYCATAFEVVILFHDRKKHVLSVIFAVLWALVVSFSMVTTVSVFYDRYNFSAVELKKEENMDKAKMFSFEMLQKKEDALRESISFKKQDIAYRQEHDYATSAVRLELEKLQSELQDNLEEQRKLLESSPEAVKEEETVKKESLFAFLGRLIGLDGGILEFIMSTLSAVFINLISPLSVSVVISFLGGMKNESSKGYSEGKASCKEE